MQCPFCAADLTQENHVGNGRYSCPACAPTSRIALLKEKEEKQRGRALELVRKQIPGYYVPVHCPSCERRDLGRQATVDETRPHYTERDEAAD
jgi:uncharacterized Zn finger protein (UPF0148 family)